MHHILHRTGGKDHPNRKYSQKPFLNTSMQSGGTYSLTLGLPYLALRSVPHPGTSHPSYKDANLLKGGIVYADKVTTVSRSYAEEIKTSFYGEGLEGLMNARANDLWGIVNGLDYNDWNPDTDYRLAKWRNIFSYFGSPVPSTAICTASWHISSII